MPVPALSYLQAKFQTIDSLVIDVARELQLSPPASPYASTDATMLKLLTMAKVLGRDLLRKNNWQMMSGTHTIVTVGGGTNDNPTTYPLPDDYLKLIDQTNWNRTTMLPQYGPIDPGLWEWLVSTLSNGLTLYLGFRLWGDVYVCYPNPNPVGLTLSFEYMSRNWVQAAGTNAFDSRTDGFASGSDLVLFDPLLFSRGLKLRWLADVGEDTSAADADFKTAWESAVGPDAGAPRLNFARPPLGVRYLDPRSNTPEGNWGH